MASVAGVINSAVQGNIDDITVRTAVADATSPVTTANDNMQKLTSEGIDFDTLVDAFKEALLGGSVEMDDETMGKFVTRTIVNEIYT